MKLSYFESYLEKHGPTILESVIIFVIGWYMIDIIMSMIKKMMLKSKLENIVVTFVNSLLTIIFKVILGIITISHLGVDTASFVTVLATAGAAVVLGLKDSLSGLASGIIILITKPFKQGDYIKVGEYEGFVSKIEIMDTYLLTRLEETIVIPNNTMTTNTVINYSMDNKRKLMLSFNVHYDSDIEHVKEVIKKVLDDHPKVNHKEQYFIRITDCKDSSIEVSIKVWTKTKDYWDVHDDLIEEMKLAFDQENIVVPYNQIDVHVDK